MPFLDLSQLDTNAFRRSRGIVNVSPEVWHENIKELGKSSKHFISTAHEDE